MDTDTYYVIFDQFDERFVMEFKTSAEAYSMLDNMKNEFRFEFDRQIQRYIVGTVTIEDDN
jgi:hypothetical protein